MSLPARGVWIEILAVCQGGGWETGHSPQGECGLKSAFTATTPPERPSLPARGVWIEIHSLSIAALSFWQSLPARGVWIEMSAIATACRTDSSHSPQGECGLKFPYRKLFLAPVLSLPARGVWIEIPGYIAMSHQAPGHSPQGECGLKSISVQN